jgi:hypothetical protein
MIGINPNYADFDKTSGETPVVNNTAVKILDAPAAGFAIFVSDIYIVNRHATVGTAISLLDDDVPVFTGFAPAVTVELKQDPINVHFEKPLRISAAKQLNIKAGTTGASFYWNVSGFVAKVYG